MTVLYPNMCANQMCYKQTALYVFVYFRDHQACQDHQDLRVIWVSTINQKRDPRESQDLRVFLVHQVSMSKKISLRKTE